MSVYNNYVSLVGHDYDKISQIAERYDISNDQNEWAHEDPKEIIEMALEKLLMDADQKGAKVLINCGKERKEDTISVFAGFDASRQTLNGIVGVLSGTETIESISENEEKDGEPNKTDKDVFVIRIELRIKSRMDNNDNYYFVYSLLNMNHNRSHDRNVFSSEDDMFDYLLIDMFADGIRRVIPKGHYRRYQRFEKNNDRLKGTINIANHIKYNMGIDNGCVYYSYRENTVCNYFNALLLCAYEHLKDKHPGIMEDKMDSDVGIKDFLSVLKYQLADMHADASTLLIKNQSPIVHPFYADYEELRKLCFLILRDTGVSLFDETERTEVRGFLYYLPDLWEQFLERVIREDLEKDVYLNPNEEQVVKRYYGGESRPDYSFSTDPQSDNTFLILDAKFIPGWKNSIGHGAFSVEKDNIDKCIRDMVVANALATGVIFPIASDEWENDEEIYNIGYIKRDISIYNSRQEFYTFPVIIPIAEDEESYSEWEKRFNSKSLFAFKSVLNNEINCIRDKYLCIDTDKCI